MAEMVHTTPADCIFKVSVLESLYCFERKGENDLRGAFFITVLSGECPVDNKK